MIQIKQSIKNFDSSSILAGYPLVQDESGPGNCRINVESLRNTFDSSKTSSISTPAKNNVNHIIINRLVNIQLQSPLDVIVESDDSGFIARTPDLPLYAFSDDPIEVIDSLKSEIESLYNDLMEDDEFTEEWLNIKTFLKKIVKGH